MTKNNKKDMDLRLVTDVQKSLNDLKKVVARQDEMIAKLKEMNKESKKAKESLEEVASPFQDMAKAAAGIAGGMSLFEGGAAALRETWSAITADFEKWKRLSEEYANKNLTFKNDFANQVWDSFGPEYIDSANTRAEQLTRDTNLTLDEVSQLWGAYQGGRRGGDINDTFGALEKVSHIPQGQRSALLSQAGTLQKTFGIYGYDIPQDDVFDMLTLMRREAGSDSAAITSARKGISKLLAQGASPEEALGGMMAGISSGLGSRGVDSLTSFLTQNITPPTQGRGQRMSDEDRLKMEVAGMSSVERLRWLGAASDDDIKSIAGSSSSNIMPLVAAGRSRDWKANIIDAMENNLFTGNIDIFKHSKIGKYTEIKEAIESFDDKQAVSNESLISQGLARKTLDTAIEQTPQISAWGGDIIRQLNNLKMYTNEGVADAIKILESYADDLGDPGAKKKILRFGPHDTVKFSDEPTNPNYNQSAAKALDKMAELLEGILDYQKQQVDIAIESKKDNVAEQPVPGGEE